VRSVGWIEGEEIRTVSFVAKVFVVLNLIMSVFFLGIVMFEWAALTKWQKMYEVEKGRGVELVAKQQQFERSLVENIVKAQGDAAKAKNDLSAVKVELNDSKDQILTANAEKAKVENARQVAETETKEMGRQKDRAMEFVAKASGVMIKQQQALTVERDKAIQFKDEKTRLETDLNQANAQLSGANREARRAQEELAYANNKLEDMVRRFGAPALEVSGDNLTQPVIEGKVLAVRMDANLLMLSVGGQQNVKTGYTFLISKGSEFIGKVVVDKVYPEMCSAHIIPGMSSKNAVFETNQDARTR
jgi:predicted  nucleic acid-binding Zn-ribbon protein